MNYALYIARKLSLTGSGRKRTPATAVATAAVTLSIMVMLASVAIVTGFKNEITDRVVGFNSHMSLSVMPGNTGTDNIVRLSPTLCKILDETSDIKEYGPQVSMPAILKTPEDFKGIYVRNMPTSASREFMTSNIVSGHLPDHTASADDAEILVSDAAARQLGLKAGEKIDVYFMSDDVRVRRLKIAGIYNSHFDSYDNIYAFAPLSLLDELTGLTAEEGVAIAVETADLNRLEETTDQLRHILVEGSANGALPKLLHVENAKTQGSNFFRWLSLLDMNVLVVIALMTAVACITLISGMLIIILDKKQFIGLMKALGTPNRNLRKVFVYLAMRICLTGIVIGNGVMLILLWLQDKYHLIPLDPEAYYIDFVPAEISWTAVVVLNIGVIVLTYLTLMLPSRFVSRISPAELLV